ncbi:zinc ribbon domain-containing protein [Methanobrevibacter sp.]|uniref:zinc ribbon domain-containing protein n=1 Tax=Methanobrevibacter sp. TaxID=66852 RepID=UPI00386F7677
MKKCPECGNPSYDGAPVCGNCGYKFPKAKVATNREDIFQREQKTKKTSNDKSVVDILKEKKLLIGIILLITLIVICGIVLTGSDNNSTPIQSIDLAEFSAGDFSFKYPKDWKEIKQKDDEHHGAKFFKNSDNTTIEYYNVSNDSKSLKDITQDRLSYAQSTGSYVELVETVTIDGRNASNIILENANGDYTRFVSMFSEGKLYVFKINGDSINSITTDDINSVVNSANIA